jgi:glycosyltransferase involved in cell wall biosynthesis
MAKKALILGEAFYPEDFIINDLAKEWSNNGYEIEVLTRARSYPFGKVFKGYRNKIYQTTNFNNIKIHRFPVIQGYNKSIILKILNYFSFVFWSVIISLFIGKRYDKVFIYQTGPLTLATAGILIKKLYRADLTIWTQDLWPDSVYAFGFKKNKLLTSFLNRLVNFVYQNCDTILVSCKGFSKRIHEYVPNKTISWIPNWPLVEYKVKAKVKLPGKFNFTFAGNIGKVQNLENIILGFSDFVKNNPDAYLNIVGDGSNLNNLQELVASRSVPNINFTGRKPLEDMPAYFEASDALLISLIDTPIYEITIPSKFQTYLTSARPIYTIMNGEVVELTEKYNLGFTASPSNIDSIASGFSKFMNLSKKDLIAISQNTKDLLSSEFSKEKILKKLTEIFWKE